jgi:hypothetical protein
MLTTLEDMYVRNKLNMDSMNVDSVIIPNNIGMNECDSTLSRKMYIRPFDKCPICYDEIIRKNDAYLTICGHGFHKKCLFKAYEIKQQVKSKSNFKCPCCRTNLGLDMEEINDKYDIWNGSEMDCLENFWIKKDFIMPHICKNINNGNINQTHWYGMNQNCAKCIKYCKTGNL